METIMPVDIIKTSTKSWKPKRNLSTALMFFSTWVIPSRIKPPRN